MLYKFEKITCFKGLITQIKFVMIKNKPVDGLFPNAFTFASKCFVCVPNYSRF